MNDYGFIYITHDLTNGKKYIGKKNYDTDGRWKKYLGSGIYLKRAVKKRGVENFYREIIDTAETSEELSEKEKYWISYYDAVKSDEYYNIAPGGDGGDVTSGYSERKLEEYIKRRRIALSNASKERCGEKSSRAKMTDAKASEIVSDIISGMYTVAIAKKHNVNVNVVADIRNHKTWKHLTDGVVFPPTNGREPGIGKSAGKPVDVFDIENNYIATFDNARKAGEALNIGYKLISKVCRGKRPMTHNYIFRFHTETDISNAHQGNSIDNVDQHNDEQMVSR